MFTNKIKRQFKKISITGRLAFGIKCLEQYVNENKLENKWIDRLIDTLWEFTTSEDLGEWDKKISDLEPNNILDTHPNNNAEDYESLTESEFNNLKDFYQNSSEDFIYLADTIIDIGTTNLYGATGSYSKNTLESTMFIYEFAKEKLKSIPDIEKFKISKYSERYGWGNRIEKKAFG